MATKRSRNVDYKQLDNISSVMLYNTAPKRRKMLPATYFVERIISMRRTKYDDEFLIKWSGWPLSSCTWEPADHLSEELVRSYKKPSMPGHERLEAASRIFYLGILTKLRSKSVAPTNVLIDLDIWRYVVHGKGTESNHKGYWLYAVDDMRRMQLPEHWWYFLDSHGEGKAVEQLKVKPILSWTPNKQIIRNGELALAPKVPIEKLCIDMITRPCNVNNL